MTLLGTIKKRGANSPRSPLSYQTLFQYHTSKQKHKNTTWYWGHDQKAIKAWDNSCPNKGFNKKTNKQTKKNKKQKQNKTKTKQNKNKKKTRKRKKKERKKEEEEEKKKKPETCKNTLYTQSNKYTRHAPKWNQSNHPSSGPPAEHLE